jgi:hypothetical protein
MFGAATGENIDAVAASEQADDLIQDKGFGQLGKFTDDKCDIHGVSPRELMGHCTCLLRDKQTPPGKVDGAQREAPDGESMRW